MMIYLAFAFQVAIFVPFCHKASKFSDDLLSIRYHLLVGIIHQYHSSGSLKIVRVIHRYHSLGSFKIVRVIHRYHSLGSFKIVGVIHQYHSSGSFKIVGVIHQYHSSGSFKIVGVIHWAHSKLLGSFISIIHQAHSKLSGSFSVSIIGLIQNCQCHSLGSFIGGNSRNTRLSGHVTLTGSFVREN